MIVDIVAVLILLASAVISILRGFIREVLTIFGLVGGALAAYVGGPLLSPTISGWLGITDGDEEQKFLDLLPYPMVANILAYAVIFIIFVIIFSILSHFLAASIKNFGLGAIDRTLGMVFGIVRGVLFLGLLYLPIHYLVEEEQMEEWDWLETSQSRVYLNATSGWISGFIPSESMADLEQSVGQITEDVSSVTKARKKLEELDLLQKKDATSDQNNSPENKEGYSQGFRNEMDQLIENAADN